jgi:uncharacterized membrane protein
MFFFRKHVLVVYRQLLGGDLGNFRLDPKSQIYLGYLATVHFVSFV